MQINGGYWIERIEFFFWILSPEILSDNQPRFVNTENRHWKRRRTMWAPHSKWPSKEQENKSPTLLENMLLNRLHNRPFKESVNVATELENVPSPGQLFSRVRVVRIMSLRVQQCPCSLSCKALPRPVLGAPHWIPSHRRRQRDSSIISRVCSVIWLQIISIWLVDTPSRWDHWSPLMWLAPVLERTILSVDQKVADYRVNGEFCAKGI